MLLLRSRPVGLQGRLTPAVTVLFKLVVVIGFFTDYYGLILWFISEAIYDYLFTPQPAEKILK